MAKRADSKSVVCEFNSHEKYQYMGRYTVSGSGADCKSAVFGLGWFDSISFHHNSKIDAVIIFASMIESLMRCETPATPAYSSRDEKAANGPLRCVKYRGEMIIAVRCYHPKYG